MSCFHVEISVGIRHARAFNLDRDELLEKVVGPWLEDRPIKLGDREWLPRESSLKVLEGPHMEPPDLSFGQGWSNAERGSENVTRRVLEEAPPPRLPDAYLVEAGAPEETTGAPVQAAAAMVAEGSGRPLPWREAIEMIDRRDPEIAAIVLVTRRRPEREPPRS
jgi:hypothetical protein